MTKNTAARTRFKIEAALELEIALMLVVMAFRVDDES